MIVHAVTDFLFADTTKGWYIMFPMWVQRLLRHFEKLEGKYYQTLVAAVRWNQGWQDGMCQEPLQNAAGVIILCPCDISVRHFRFVSPSVCCRSP